MLSVYSFTATLPGGTVDLFKFSDAELLLIHENETYQLVA